MRRWWWRGRKAALELRAGNGNMPIMGRRIASTGSARQRGLEEPADAFAGEDGFGLHDLLGRQIGRRLVSESDLVRAVTSKFLTLGIVESLKRHGWMPEEIFKTVIPRRTFDLRRSKGEVTLTAEETDRAIRGARIVAMAELAFGDRAKALAWLRKPKAFLGGLVPMEVLALSEPTRVIEEKLLQLEHGMAA